MPKERGGRLKCGGNEAIKWMLRVFVGEFCDVERFETLAGNRPFKKLPSDPVGFSLEWTPSQNQA
jgi:hypothetical protein